MRLVGQIVSRDFIDWNDEMGIAERAASEFRQSSPGRPPKLAHPRSLAVAIFPGLHAFAFDSETAAADSDVHVVRLCLSPLLGTEGHLPAGAPVRGSYQHLKQPAIRLAPLFVHEPRRTC